MIRNLLYNCCPFTHNDEWRLNLEELGRYGSAFNGRKIVLVKTGIDLESIDSVRKALPFETEVWGIPNHQELQEVAGFIEGLNALRSESADEITFYAHTKGVTYSRSCDPRFIERVRWWRDTMYAQCLSDLDKVESAFVTHACAGCFRSRELLPTPYYPRPERPWYFAGNYWWVKHSALFSLPNWNQVRQDRYGVEAYLSDHFTVDQSFCLYQDNVENLYEGVP